jgi:uncharacterized protein
LELLGGGAAIDFFVMDPGGFCLLFRSGLMVVGVMIWELSLPGCSSLKEKRMVVRSLKDRIHHRFKVSVAETGHQDVWTRAQMAVAVVSGDGAHAEEVLDHVDRMVGQNGRALVMERRRDLY